MSKELKNNQSVSAILEQKEIDPVHNEGIGKVISQTEALHIVRNILENAEKERLKIAEYEAERGIQWENEV